MTGTSTTTATGPFEVALQLAGQAIQSTGSERFAEELLRKLNQPGKGRFTIEANAAAPAHDGLKGEFVLDAKPGVLEGETFRPTTGLRLLVRTGDGPIGPLYERNLPASEETPCYAARQEEELSLAVPDGYQPIQLPKNLTLNGSFFHYESRWSFAEKTINVQRSLVSTFDQPLCKSENRAEAAKALSAIRRDIDAQIGLKRAE